MHADNIKQWLPDNPKQDPQVVWQRHAGMTQYNAKNTQTTRAMYMDDVIATCQGCPYQPKECTKQTLDFARLYSVSFAKDMLNIHCTLEWMHANQIFTLNVETNQTYNVS